jgi:hypothetical protein
MDVDIDNNDYEVGVAMMAMVVDESEFEGESLMSEI